MSERKLPPDPENMNDQRAEWAQGAIDGFLGVCRTDDGDALADMLCDLMHLCDRKDDYGPFEEALRRARSNYEAEIMEEPTDA